MQRFFFPFMICFALACHPGSAMELEWTRGTGQFRYEATPLLVDLQGDGVRQILGVNLGGQVLLWNLDGSDAGAGQDGTVATLPEGTWCSTPVIAGAGEARLLVFGSVEGLLVALDPEWQQAWQFQLPGKTQWARATPVLLPSPQAASESVLLIGDLSGTVSCLSMQGAMVWQKQLETGGCSTPITLLEGDAPLLLAPAGNVLHAVTAKGDIAWSRDLGGKIISQPLVHEDKGGMRIFCGAGAGSLFALDTEGDVQWEAPIGDEIDTSIGLLPREGQTPLVLCTGLWGGCHAFTLEGKPVWTHHYRAKSRTRPLIVDANGDGAKDVLVACNDQHAYVLDADGNRIDDLRLSGILAGSPIALPSDDREDVLFVSYTLLAHRFSPGPAQPVFGQAGTVEFVDLTQDTSAGTPFSVAENPAGALLLVNERKRRADGGEDIWGTVSTQQRIAMPTPSAHDEQQEITTLVHDATGKEVRVRELRPSHRDLPPWQPEGPVHAWTVPAYADFDPLRLKPTDGERTWSDVRFSKPIYQGEQDQLSIVVANTTDEPVTYRVERPVLKNDQDLLLATTFLAREVIGVETSNGDVAYDALPRLQSSLLTIAPKRAAKLWLSFQIEEVPAGIYAGEVILQPLRAALPQVKVPVHIKVSPLALPSSGLSFCTWDYMPNNWFPQDPPTVTREDLRAHGVDTFPRSGVPKATLSEGKLVLDFAPVALDLDRLERKGIFLFHFVMPEIAGAEQLDAQARRVHQLDYLRQFRDYLHDQGLAYEDYAFYPVDEPGLDYGGRVPTFVEAATLYREADPKIRIYTDPVPGLSFKDFEAIEPLVDVWCPNMRMVTGLLHQDPRIQRIMDSGKLVWSYECISQVKSISPLRYNRGNAWRAWFFGLDGIGHWTYSTTPLNHWYSNAPSTDEYALVYPGEEPVPSVRWEGVRDGLEDVAAMRLLEQRQQERPDPEVARLIQTLRNDMMECIDDAFIESRDYLKQGDRRVWHTWWDVMLFEEARKKIEEATLAH